MKTKQFFTSFLACMTLWSAPVCAAFIPVQGYDGFIQMKNQCDLGKKRLGPITEARRLLKEANEAEKKSDKKEKFTQAKEYMINTFSDKKLFPTEMPISFYLTNEIDDTKSVKSKIIRKRIDKAIGKLEGILDRIETHVTKKQDKFCKEAAILQQKSIKKEKEKEKRRRREGEEKEIIATSWSPPLQGRQ